MTASNNLPSKLEQLAERYNTNPALRLLAGLIPGVSQLDAAISVQIANMHTERMRIFFDELATKSRLITDADVKNSDYIHAFLSTAKAAINTRQHEKIRLFARLLANYTSTDMTKTGEDQEDFLHILDDLSYREYQVLLILHDFKIRLPPEDAAVFEISEEDAFHRTLMSWIPVMDSIETKTGIPLAELPGVLERLKRTGLYQAFTIVQGSPVYHRGVNIAREIGFLTPNFDKFIKAFEDGTNV